MTDLRRTARTDHQLGTRPALDNQLGTNRAGRRLLRPQQLESEPTFLINDNQLGKSLISGGFGTDI